MFTFSLPWNRCGTRIVAPDDASAGGGGEGRSQESGVRGQTEALTAPPETPRKAQARDPKGRYTAEDLEGLGEGADLLLGAEIGGVALEEDDEQDDEERETAAKLKAESEKQKANEEEEESGVRGQESGEGDEQRTSDTENAPGETKPAEPTTETLTALQTQLSEARAEIERLKAGGEGAPAPAPTRENPLAHVTNADGLRNQERLAIEAKRWARRNPDGGEMPAELHARLRGAKAPADGAEPVTLTRDEVLNLMDNAETMLEEHLPARREYLAQETNVRAFWKKEHPEYLDPATKEGQFISQIERQWPGVKHNPGWLGLLICAARGSRAFEEESKANAEKLKTEKLKAEGSEIGKLKPETHPRLAPVPPRANGARTTTGKPTTQRPVKLRLDMSDEELAETM